MSGGHASNVHVMWTKTLDPKSPDFGYHDDTVVAKTNGVEDADAIDPSFLYQTAPLDQLRHLLRFIRVLELDPKTGKALSTSKPVDVAIDMEATDLIYKDGWYYLLGTHGTCCDGANSTYNIRVGRARKVTGPYVDNMGLPLLKGGGKLVVARVGATWVPGTSAVCYWAMMWRSSPAITRQTSTAAAAACWIFVRCCGKTDGQSAAITSRGGTYEIPIPAQRRCPGVGG